MATTITHTAKAQGVSVNDYILDAIQAKLDNDTHQEEIFFFDIDVMTERLKGLETKELALKNSVEVPAWVLTDFESFDRWLTQRKASKAVA